MQSSSQRVGRSLEGAGSGVGRRCPAALAAAVVLLWVSAAAGVGCFRAGDSPSSDAQVSAAQSGSNAPEPPLSGGTLQPQPPAPAAALCSLRGQLVGPEGVLDRLEVEMSSSVPTSDRTWTGVASATATSGVDGRFGFEVPCGARVDLSVDGWSWINAPNTWLAEAEMPEMRVALAPEISVRLFVQGGNGPRPEGVQFLRPGDTVGVPVPYEGLALIGIGLHRLAGEIRSADLPSRPWRLVRSDDLEELGPGHYEAVVILGRVPTCWVGMAPKDFVEVGGVHCIVDDGRGDACRRTQGIWRCDCPVGSSVGIHGK